MQTQIKELIKQVINDKVKAINESILTLLSKDDAVMILNRISEEINFGIEDIEMQIPIKNNQLFSFKQVENAVFESFRDEENFNHKNYIKQDTDTAGFSIHNDNKIKLEYVETIFDENLFKNDLVEALRNNLIK
jgi:hypothetical protein